MNELVTIRIDSYSQRLAKLLNSEAKSIDEFDEFRKTNEAVRQRGVYALCRPDTDAVVYVGRTKTGDTARRIGDHQAGSALSSYTSSDLPEMLQGSRHLPQKANEYRVRYVVIEEDRDRLFFEHFAIGVLQPELNK